MQTTPILKLVDSEAVLNPQHFVRLWDMEFGGARFPNLANDIVILDGGSLLVTNHAGVIHIDRVVNE